MAVQTSSQCLRVQWVCSSCLSGFQVTWLELLFCSPLKTRKLQTPHTLRNTTRTHTHTHIQTDPKKHHPPLSHTHTHIPSVFRVWRYYDWIVIIKHAPGFQRSHFDWLEWWFMILAHTLTQSGSAALSLANTLRKRTQDTEPYYST